MSEPSLLIRNATIVTAYGLKEADIWIEHGKIKRVAKDTFSVRVEGEAPLVIDAAEYYLLPGFIQFLSRQTKHHQPKAAYVEEIRRQIAQGVTTVVDSIRLESWMDELQLHYQLTPHYNSPIDYAVRVNLEVHTFTPKRIRKLRDQGFRLLELTVQSLDEVKKIDWDNLYPLFHDARLAVHLHTPKESVTREQRRLINEWWLQHCFFGKIRTCMEEIEPAHTDKDDFYRIAMIGGEQIERVLHTIQQNWFGYLPVICPIDRFAERLRKKAYRPDKLLSLLVRVASTNMAKAIGCYPQKGSLLPGADADILFISKQNWLTNYELSSILNFSEICKIAHVMSKGKWVFHEGEHIPVIGTGNILKNLQPYNYAI
ncbi:amidohydrolase family protein [Brevibacillus dissolubilis]|uniref:amidohydrolase family protein n=1 Tax=Brevibacillus dissolubilis TaxID=1844116 RepID=UPI00159BBF18|nr:amidohydrolase family protein [Brevibacillus dissolubilis]